LWSEAGVDVILAEGLERRRGPGGAQPAAQRGRWKNTCLDRPV